MTGDLNQAIDQIADKLGVAADQVAGVIPQYAQMKCMTCGAWASVLFVCAGIFAIFAIVSVGRYRKADDLAEKDERFTYVLITTAFAVVLLFIAVKLVIDCIGWGQYPYAMVADMVVQVMGVGH